MKTADRARAAQVGQTLVEFALVLPMLFLLFVNAVNFAGFLFAWITVANTARTGAQYMIMGGATVQSPKPPSASQIAAVITTDISSLLNRTSLVVRVCTRSPSNSTNVVCATPKGSGSFSDPPADPRAEAGLYVMGWVDVLYTYEPFIPLFKFPGLNISATLPPLSVHRQTVMRMLQ